MALMRNRADQFVKSILRAALILVGAAETEVEVTQASQKIDVWCVPDPARASMRAELGFLGELATEPCMFEPFHDTPGLRQVRGCMRKQLTWHHELERRARAEHSEPAGATATAFQDEKVHRKSRREVPFPLLFIPSTGRPEQVIAAFRCELVRSGLYSAVPGLRMHLLILSELPQTRSTLLLRLLGTGRVLSDALSELMALPDDAMEKSVALPLLVHFGFEMPAEPGAEEDHVTMEIQEWFKEYQQKLREEGRNLGRKEVLARQFEKRLTRRLTEEERATLAERLDRLGEDRLDEIVLTLSSEELAVWLADEAAR